MLGLQIAFYGLAWAGVHTQRRGRFGKLLYVLSFLVTSNLASLVGVYRHVTRRQTPDVASRGETGRGKVGMTRHLRALIVDLSTRFGGTSARVLGLMAGMPAGSVILASLADSPVTSQALAAGLEMRTVGRSKWDLRIAGRIAALAGELNVQVIDAQNPQSKLWASQAAARLPVAFVSTLNSWYLAEHGGNLKGRVYHSLERWTSRGLDLYIAVSREIEQQLLASGVQPDQIARVENAIRNDLTAPPADMAGLRRRYGFDPASRRWSAPSAAW